MTVPDAPTDLIPVIDDSQVTISFTAGSDGGSAITDYVIQYSTNGSDWTTFSDGTSTSTTIIVTGLTNEQLYLFRIAAVNGDGTGSYSDIATATPLAGREPEYCQPSDLADWFRIPINANTDPNTTMVKNFIMDNEDIIDRKTGHSWLTDKKYLTDTFDVPDIYDYGRGLYIPLKHRNIKPWDASKGDLVQLWNGIQWVDQEIESGNSFITFETTKGTMHIRGYIYTMLRKSRFRVSYRYGGSKEKVGNETIPRDIKKACKLMTAIDMLTTDFKFSKIGYGGEGQVDKTQLIQKWQELVDGIIHDHSEMLVVW